MVTKINLKEKYINLSELNQQTIFYMAKLIHKQDSKDFKIGEFIGKVAKELNSAKPTVQRLYYTYITKHSPEELSELGAYFDMEGVVKSEEVTLGIGEGKVKKQMISFKNQMIAVHEEDGKFFFVVDELLNALPVSRTNKALKNSLSVKGRKILKIDGENYQCIDAEKVKTFLQSFIRQVQEGPQKEDIRFFLEKVHQLSLKNANFYAQPVIQELRPVVKEENSKVSEVKIFKEENSKASDVKVFKEEKNPSEKKVDVAPKVENQPKKEQGNVVAIKSFDMLKGLKSEILKQEQTKEVAFNVDETEEMKALTKILNNHIGYLSPNAKNKLYELTSQNGLVNTVVATLEMLESMQKDTSLYFVNKIESHLNGMVNEVTYKLTAHAVMRAKERANVTDIELIEMAKKAVFYAETESKKYVQYKDYILVLAKEEKNVYTIVTILFAKWFNDALIMQEQIDRHL